MRFAVLAAAFGLAALSGATLAAEPVRYGGEATLDACAGSGWVSGLNPRGDNYLSVRAAPTTRGRELARLGPGTDVIICDERGRWLGIVYGGGDCGTSSPVAQRQPYPGPCASGWVFDKYVTPGAG